MDACMYVVARNVYRHRFCLVAAWIVATLIFTVPALVLVLRRTVAELQTAPKMQPEPTERDCPKVGMDKTPPAGTQSAAAMEVLDSHHGPGFCFGGCRIASQTLQRFHLNWTQEEIDQSTHVVPVGSIIHADSLPICMLMLMIVSFSRAPSAEVFFGLLPPPSSGLAPLSWGLKMSVCFGLLSMLSFCGFVDSARPEGICQ